MPSAAAFQDLAVVPSPCTNVCRMDERSGWCAGCMRTLDEIAGWATLNDKAKLEVWDQLAARRASCQAGAADSP